jgi:hypothetical protein
MDYVVSDIKELKDRAKKIDKTVISNNRYRYQTACLYLSRYCISTVNKKDLRILQLFCE